MYGILSSHHSYTLQVFFFLYIVAVGANRNACQRCQQATFQPCRYRDSSLLPFWTPAVSSDSYTHSPLLPIVHAILLASPFPYLPLSPLPDHSLTQSTRPPYSSFFSLYSFWSFLLSRSLISFSRNGLRNSHTSYVPFDPRFRSSFFFFFFFTPSKKKKKE